MTKLRLLDGSGSISAETRSPKETERRGAKTYRMNFPHERERPCKEVEFEAEDAYRALVITQQEARQRAADLWLDGRKLCSIARRGDDFWEIQPAR